MNSAIEHVITDMTCQRQFHPFFLMRSAFSMRFSLAFGHLRLTVVRL